MELPPALRAAIDGLASRYAQADLIRAGEALSRRYRAETRDGRQHLDDEISAAAYVAARMPATFAALRDCMGRIAEGHPSFAPRSLLDVGAGPGTALWAATQEWFIAQATLVEASAPIRQVGAWLAENAFPFEPLYVAGNATTGFTAEPCDLVTLAYVLDELEPAAIAPLVDRLWSLTRDVLLVVEPGTPAGWRRILTVRSQLLDAGAHVLAPCPYARACPVAAPDWCHFARRLPRSRLHRLMKGGEAPFEDEKFAYLAVSRTLAEHREARVLAMPRSASGRVDLKLCTPDGRLAQRVVTRREGEVFRRAKRASWGDALE